MSDRTGSGLAELAVLETVSAATGGRPRAHIVCTKAVAAIEERIGLGPRYGYEVLLDLARPWIIPVPTVSVEGNKGDRSFPEAAAPQYTECRPSHAGQLVLDAEAHRLAPVPAGIINGTTYRGGVQPPLEPFRVLAALRRLLEDPRVPDGEVLSIAGLPYSTAGCEPTGDLDALMNGRRVVVRETAKITITGVPVPPAAAEPPTPVRPRVAVGAVASPRQYHRSDPHTQASTTLTMASVGSAMTGSGRSATSTEPGPLNTAARMTASPLSTFLSVTQLREPGSDAGRETALIGVPAETPSGRVCNPVCSLEGNRPGADSAGNRLRNGPGPAARGFGPAAQRDGARAEVLEGVPAGSPLRCRPPLPWTAWTPGTTSESS